MTAEVIDIAVARSKRQRGRYIAALMAVAAIALGVGAFIVWKRGKK